MNRANSPVYVVTGASSGLGLAISELLLREKVTVVMVSQNERRAARAFELMNRLGRGSALLKRADLASMSSVRKLADRIRGQFGRLDGLVNNAGILSARRTVTGEGMEKTMAVNHLAPFLLSHLLRDLLATAGGRIVTVSSNGHRAGDLRRAPLEDIIRGRAWPGMMKAYGDSKLANILFTFEWSRRMSESGVIANALHPGVLRTRVWNRNFHPLSLFMQPFRVFMARPVIGARAVVRLLRAGAGDEGGQYFDKEVPARASEQAYDEKLAAALWDVSEGLTDLR